MDEIKNGPSGLEALVVDDESGDLNKVIIFLSDRGYNVTGVTDGNSAIELARKKRYDIMTVDCSMPEILGYEVAAQVKATALNQGTPIVMVSNTNWDPMFKESIDFYVPKYRMEAELPKVLARINPGYS